MADKYTFGTEGPWITDEEIQRRAEYNAKITAELKRQQAAQEKRTKRLARYRKIGRFNGGLAVVAIAIGTMVAAGFALSGLVRWLHVPGYVVVPASLWGLGVWFLKVALAPKRKD